ncbi:hypothetical protein RR46_14538 [Papilio xuthus]|uniref:Uncharacterized protein n=1 Tax=Papilio xuthus TaxID=66420 RepID=A0A194PEB5_PAPXU|nr:hypothetical protein RR46_14538 [Papilio xuthus]
MIDVIIQCIVSLNFRQTRLVHLLLLLTRRRNGNARLAYTRRKDKRQEGKREPARALGATERDRQGKGASGGGPAILPRRPRTSL